jgi:hypothetical protein
MKDLLEDYRKLVKKYLSSEYNSEEHLQFQIEEPILFEKIMKKGIDKKTLYDIIKDVDKEIHGKNYYDNL